MPPKKRKRAGGPLVSTANKLPRQYRSWQEAQVSLGRRLNRTASMAELLPAVFAATLGPTILRRSITFPEAK